MPATYKIGEAASILDLRTYVLRFWETEFPQVVPLRTEKGQRLYTQEHIDLLARIKYLLHERGMTIEGARKELSTPVTPAAQPTPLLEPFVSPPRPSLQAPIARKNQTESAAEHYVRMLIDETDIPESGPLLVLVPPQQQQQTPPQTTEQNTPLLHNAQLMSEVLSELENIAALLRS